MCGFAGQFRLDGKPPAWEAVEAAAKRLALRGPDDASSWRDERAALSFRRLSILDLEGGRQPMASEDGRFHVVFNGEIYNHPGLKHELEARGVCYRTRSDTETILHVCRRDGENAVRRLEGMFAFALYDAREGRLTLARDPLGVKPLYYHLQDNVLSFASELRALALLLPSVSLDCASVVDYLSYGIVHAPRTALEGARKLPPGHQLVFDAKGLKVRRFWELEASKPDSKHRKEIGFEQALGEVESLLKRSVKSQLLSDVPVGAFLSGGVDSSLVTALMARETGGKVPTFSIGFSGARAGLDESAHARAVAAHLGTDHHELVLPAGVLEGVEELSGCLDEPIADSAILPTFLLARFARQSVKVVLSGEGADELFAGYNRYKAAYLSERVGAIPGWSRGLAAFAARRLGKGRVFQNIPYDRASDWARAFAHAEPPAYASLLRPGFLDGLREDPFDWLGSFERPHSLGEAQVFDLKTVLPDALLMKVDKATMRASLEARVPYLDRRLVEYAFALPPSVKMHRLKGKYLLRRLAEKYLPKAIATRRKHGFIVPWEEWTRSPQNRLFDEMASSEDFAALGIFDPAALKERVALLRQGSRAVDSGIAYRIAVFWLWFQGLKA